jgi:hypothetical protein
LGQNQESAPLDTQLFIITMHTRIVYWKVVCDGCGKETRVDTMKYFAPADWAGDLFYKKYNSQAYDPNKDYCPTCKQREETKETFK